MAGTEQSDLGSHSHRGPSWQRLLHTWLPSPWPWELTSACTPGGNAHTGSLRRGWGPDLEVVSSLLPIQSIGQNLNGQSEDST